MAASAIANRELYNRLGLMFRGVQQEAYNQWAAWDAEFNRDETTVPEPTFAENMWKMLCELTLVPAVPLLNHVRGLSGSEHPTRKLHPAYILRDAEARLTIEVEPSTDLAFVRLRGLMEPRPHTLLLRAAGDSLSFTASDEEQGTYDSTGTRDEVAAIIVGLESGNAVFEILIPADEP